MYKVKIERIRGENRCSVILVGDYNNLFSMMYKKTGRR